jgi:hypothetical protein
MSLRLFGVADEASQRHVTNDVRDNKATVCLNCFVKYECRETEEANKELIISLVLRESSRAFKLKYKGKELDLDGFIERNTI